MNENSLSNLHRQIRVTFIKSSSEIHNTHFSDLVRMTLAILFGVSTTYLRVTFNTTCSTIIFGLCAG